MVGNSVVGGGRCQHCGLGGGREQCNPPMSQKDSVVVDAAVLFGDLIKTLEINAEAESSIFLFDKKNGGSMRRSCRSDETSMEVFLNEFTEGLEFNLG